MHTYLTLFENAVNMSSSQMPTSLDIHPSLPICVFDIIIWYVGNLLCIKNIRNKMKCSGDDENNIML